MNAKNNNSEKGQAIVFLVVGLIVFLGFVALAIDGGMALADRRHSQNGADASSLAGGGKAATILGQLGCPPEPVCTSATLYNSETAAINRAAENGFTIDRDLTDHNGVNATCPTGKYIDVTVDISATTPSNFLQLIFPDALHNEVDAVTRVYPGGPVSFGNAITALNPENCADSGFQGVIVGGSGTVHVTGGDIFSNGCIRQNSEVDVDVVPPNQALGHTFFKSEDWADYTDKYIDPEQYRINPPDCSDTGGAFHYTGKQFENMLKSGSGTLASGLYCISGDVTINQGNKIDGPGVTIDMLDGKFIVNGPADIRLLAPGVPTDPDNPDSEKTPIVSPAVEGLLIYLPTYNSNVVTLNGNADSKFSGLVYAPSSTVTLTGTGQNVYKNSQVIGWNVLIEGTSDLTLTYDGCAGYIASPSLDLHK